MCLPFLSVPLWPVAMHAFLNVRTYVRIDGEPAIFFLAEWVPNRLAAFLAPRAFGLPYRTARIRYRQDPARGRLEGRVVPLPGTGSFVYSGRYWVTSFRRAFPGSLEEFLLERYVAGTKRHALRRCFRVAHEPWTLVPVVVEGLDDRLLAATGSWFPSARFVCAHFSPGVARVRIGHPRITDSPHPAREPRRPDGCPRMSPAPVFRCVGTPPRRPDPPKAISGTRHAEDARALRS